MITATYKLTFEKKLFEDNILRYKDCPIVIDFENTAHRITDIKDAETASISRLIYELIKQINERRAE